MVDIDNKCGTNWISGHPRIMPFCIIMLALENSCPTVQKGNSALGFRKSGHQLMLYIDYKTLIANKESRGYLCSIAQVPMPVRYIFFIFKHVPK